jgi:hypothetical protein
MFRWGDGAGSQADYARKLNKEHADKMKKALLGGLVLLLGLCGQGLRAQTISGEIAVTIQDDSGAPVPKASIALVSVATGFRRSATANELGHYLFRDIPVGSYTITVVAAGFARSEQTNFPVQLNRTNAATFILQAGGEKAAPQVGPAPPPLNLTSPQIEGTYDPKELAELPTATIGLGVVNLSLLQAGVTNSGGVGAGVGPVVGGERPTNNNFTIEGVDNNNKTSSGPEIRVPNDAVGEFTALQNDFGLDFGHSNGGQYNQTIVSGTNKYHGTLYDYTQNRYLNATDQAAVVSGAQPERPRYDFSRIGGEAGGPVPFFMKGKLFFFGNGEYDPLGQATVAAGGICAPTANGYLTLAALPPGPDPNGNGTMVSPSANNLKILQTYLPPATTGGNCPTTLGNPPTGPVANPLYICTGGWVNNGGLPCPGGTPQAVDVGLLNLVAPNYTNTYYLVSGVDYNRSSTDQYRFRYIYDRSNSIDTAGELPAFYELRRIRDHLAAVDWYHTFRPDLTNELRLGYSRASLITPSGSFPFTGLDVFPNLQFLDLNAQVGPDPNSPAFAVQNDYQLSENVNWWHKKHNIRAGVEVRRYIAPTGLTQNSRGNYEYSSLGTYLYDVNPDVMAVRSNGFVNYYGDLVATSWYLGDTWRIKPSISLSYGIRYDYATVPFGERDQNLNATSSVLGLISWQEPRAPKNEFSPRFGFAWAPGASRTWSVRGGVTMGYDVLYDNLGINTIVSGAAPQLGATVDKSQPTEALIGVPGGIITNFLADGGILPGTGAFNTFGACPPPAGCGTAHTGATALANQQAATSGQIPVNLINPVAITYTGGIQHVLKKNYVIEVRYVQTHGYHEPVQVYLNRQSAITSTTYLPTFTGIPSLGQLTSLTTTLNSILSTPLGSYVPGYVAGCAVVSGLPVDGLLPNSRGQLAPAPCFTSSLSSFQPEGSSMYRGVAAQVTRHFGHGLQFTAAYTLSYDKDDSSSAFPNSVINPARPQDFQNLKADWGNSAFDHRNRLTINAYYEPPYFQSGPRWRRMLLANWFFIPVYTYQTGGWADLQSGVDSNLNGDASGDRVLVNSGGVAGTGSGVLPTCVIGGVVIVGTGLSGGKSVSCSPNCPPGSTTCASTVAYTANTSTAQYIVAGPGALEPNNSLTVAKRNILKMPPINNLDFALGKKFPITERFRLQLNAEVLNVLNHPQYIAGSLNQINAVTYTSSVFSSYVTPGSANFNNPAAVFSSNPRVIQVGAKLFF